MKRRGAELVYQRVKGLTREEELAYWQERTAELLAAQQRVREAAKNKLPDKLS